MPEAVSVVCTDCGTIPPAGARFCPNCGRRLDRAREEPPSLSPETDIRVLSALFVDMVSSSRLAETLDPDDYREILSRLREICRRAVEGRAGFVAQYLGDGLLAYFGYPIATDDHARQAIAAGLDIQAAAAGLTARPPGQDPEQLRLRVGIHAGPVIVERRSDPVASILPPADGVVLSIASRLQVQAVPGTVIVSDEVWRLAEGFFEGEPLGPVELRGIERPVSAWRALRELDIVNRFELARRRGLPPILGRQAELILLKSEWARAQAGAGRSVLLTGHPGIGKSRLIDAFRETVEAGGSTVVTLFCSETESASPYAPFAPVARRLPAGDPAAAARSLGLDGPHHAHAVMALNASGPVATPESLDPSLMTAAIHDLLSAILFPAERRPCCVVLEDMHWADPSTRSFIEDRLSRGLPPGVLVLMTQRPEALRLEVPSGAMTTLAIAELDVAHARELARWTAGDRQLSDRDLDAAVRVTGGWPLFVEEYVRAMLAAESRAESVPTSLQGLILGRLDRLEEARDVAQVASVVGAGFDAGVVAEVCGRLHLEADPALAMDRMRADQLIDLLDGDAAGPARFRHALIRETAYDSIPSRRRRAIHAVVAEVLATRASEAERPEEVARHWSLAARPDRAHPYWIEAGARAIARSANREAIAHYREAVREARSMAELGLDPGDVELVARRAMNVPLVATSGWATEELGDNARALRDLSRRIGRTDELLDAELMLFNLALLRADHDGTRRQADAIRALAIAHGGERARMTSLRSDGARALFTDGDPAAAAAAFRQALQLFDPARDRTPSSSYFYLDGEVSSLSLLAWASQFEGDAEASGGYGDQAIEVANRIDHAFNQGYALCLVGSAELCRGDADLAAAHAIRAIEIARYHGLGYWVAYGTVLDGGARLKRGETAAGRARLEEGIRLYSETGARMLLPWAQAMLASACARQGDQDAAAAALEAGRRQPSPLFRPFLDAAEAELRQRRARPE